MKRKGITIWEQHLERFVLGAAVVFFVVFAALQFVREPNSVEPSGHGTVTPSEVDGLLRTTAERLQSQLAPDAAPAVEIPEPRPLLERFTAAVSGSISPSRRLTTSNPMVVITTEIITGVDVVYVEPKLPAPHLAMARQYFDALADEEVARIPELKERFPHPPYDLTWVTAAAMFDLQSVREQFEQAGPSGEAPIPASWYRDPLDVLDVTVEREEYVDGNWGNRTTLEVLPEAVTVRDRLVGPVDNNAREEILGYLAEPGVQDAILEPAFYATINSSWTAPDPRVGGGEEPETGLTDAQREIRLLKRRLRQKNSDREELLKRLKDLGGSMRGAGGGKKKKDEEKEKGHRPPPGQGGGGGAGGAGGGQGPPGGGGSDRRKQGKKRGAPGGGLGLSAPGGAGAGPGAGERKARQIKRIQARILRLEKQIRRMEKDLAERTGGEGRQDLAAEPEHGEVRILAHDITVVPGRTYRYRFAVELYNPFYARKLNLLESQQHLADGITLKSSPSAWSDPLDVIPFRKIFITRAYDPGSRNAGSLGLGQAVAEVFRFFHGRWWQESFAVEPGDRVGGVKQVRRPPGEGDEDAPAPEAVDYGTGWFVLDIVRDIDASRDQDEQGQAAAVMLQKLGEPKQIRPFDPVTSAADPERQMLRDAVELAEIGPNLARAGGG